MSNTCATDNSLGCVGCVHRSQCQCVILFTCHLAAIRENYLPQFTDIRLGRDTIEVIFIWLILPILRTVVHGCHSVTFQEAWNMCWIAWFVRHHIAILTDYWIHRMYTDVYISFKKSAIGILSGSSAFLFVGFLIVDAGRCDRLTISYDHSTLTPTVLYIVKNPLYIHIILPRSILLTISTYWQ